MSTPAPTPHAVSDIAETLHSFPREGPSDFEPTTAYLEGIISLFAGVGAFFVLLTLSYFIFLISRCCCKCCQRGFETHLIEITPPYLDLLGIPGPKNVVPALVATIIQVIRYIRMFDIL